MTLAGLMRVDMRAGRVSATATPRRVGAVGDPVRIRSAPWLRHARPAYRSAKLWVSSTPTRSVQPRSMLAPRTSARVFGGHPVATLQAASKEFVTKTVFAHASSLLLARELGVQWLVYGPDEANLTSPAGPAFQSGVVRVYRVRPG